MTQMDDTRLKTVTKTKSERSCWVSVQGMADMNEAATLEDDADAIGDNGNSVCPFKSVLPQHLLTSCVLLTITRVKGAPVYKRGSLFSGRDGLRIPNSFLLFFFLGLFVWNMSQENSLALSLSFSHIHSLLTDARTRLNTRLETYALTCSLTHIHSHSHIHSFIVKHRSCNKKTLRYERYISWEDILSRHTCFFFLNGEIHVYRDVIDIERRTQEKVSLGISF